MPKTFLIADDNCELRELIRNSICTEDDTVYECDNGSDAILLCGKYNPDIILLDIQMPIVNGITAAEVIRKSLPGSKIIIVSNYGTPGFKRAAKKAGVNGYVLKDNLLSLKEIV